jgi:hypothetical protein
MTPLDQAVSIIHMAINALILWFIWHVPWRRSCQERYRQKLFEVRDELFDFARGGGVAFTEPAYIALRAYINSMIRFSHLIGVTRLATFILFQRYIGDVPRMYPAVNSAIAEVKGKSTKEALMAIDNKVMNHTFRHLLFASPHVLVAGPALVLLDQIISPKPVTKSPNSPLQRRHSAIAIIEVQAEDAFGSEAIKRHHDRELASV